MLSRLQRFRGRPEIMLLLMAGAVPLSFATWQALLNNFAIERAAFTGAEIGILQSLREVPGFLAFAVVFLLFLLKEQSIALISLALLGIGTAVTGVFPSIIGLYVTTVVMSIGFHYYETIQTSLSLQWIDKDKTPEVLGRMIAIGAFTSIVTFAMIWLALDVIQLEFKVVYFIGGGVPQDEVLLMVGQIRPELLLIFGTQPNGVPRVRKAIDLIREMDVVPTMNVMVSGGVFNRADGLWEEINCDLFAPTAGEALDVANSASPRTPEVRTPGVPKKKRRRRRRPPLLEQAAGTA